MSTAPIDLDVELERFARQAQSLTLAGGAAIALASPDAPSGGEMTCRASAGQAAPHVGARLQLIHGYKGDWLREGKPLRCDDSETDARVDRDRCRRLGIRSVVAVPLKNKESVVGIIEIFSTRTKAFTESHMAKLHVLAERVTDAVTGLEAAPAAEVQPTPELLWADVFVESGLPWKRLLQSALCHMVLGVVVWNVSASWKKSEEILSRPAAVPSEVTYYPSHSSFPAAGSHRPQVASAKGGSEASHPAPIMVKSAGEAPSAPSITDMPAAAGASMSGLREALPFPAMRPAPALSSVPSPQRTSLASAGRPDSAQAVVAPPPQIGTAIRQHGVAAPGSFAVGPSPTVDGPVRTMAGVSLGHSTVVAPAPGLPLHDGAMSSNLGMGGVRAVVGPPPALPLHEGAGGSGLQLGGAGNIVGPPVAMPTRDGSAESGVGLGGTVAVVGPAPSIQGGGLRRGSGRSDITLGGGDGVVAPAPGIPSGARSGVLSAGLGGTGTVVGPPPNMAAAGRGISSAGFGGSGVSVVPPPPSIGGGNGLGSGLGGASSGSGSGVGSGLGSGSGLGPGSGAGSGTGTGSGSGSGAGSGSGSGSGNGSGFGTGTGSGSGAGSGSGLGSGVVAPSPSMASLNAVAGVPRQPAKDIRSSVAPQAPTRLDDPAGRILDLPVRVLGLALALPASSYFSNYEVFIAERDFAQNETQLIKLVYESRPTQQRLSDYGVDVASTYKLRVKRDPTCDETITQITGGNYSELQNSNPDALRSADKEAMLPCYRTTADDYQKTLAKKR